MSEPVNDDMGKAVDKQRNERMNALTGALEVYDAIVCAMIEEQARVGDLPEESSLPRMRMQGDPSGVRYRIELHPSDMLHEEQLEMLLATARAQRQNFISKFGVPMAPRVTLDYHGERGLRIEVWT